MDTGRGNVLMVAGRKIVAAILALVEKIQDALPANTLFLCAYVGIIALIFRQYSFRFLGIGTKTRAVGGSKAVQVTLHEDDLFSSIVDPSKITDSFESIGGLQHVKQTLTEHILWPFSRPDLFAGGTIRSHPKGVLLYGPPGTGKTLVARALAKEVNGYFLEIRVESLFSKWMGDTEKNAAAVFTLAEKIQPCVIFIDEIDSLLSTRTSNESAVYSHTKTIFMTKWDGLAQQDARIVVVGATNRPLALDDAILRRLPLRLEVKEPDLESRKKILDILLKHDINKSNTAATNDLVGFVAGKTAGYTGSDLKELCKTAAMIPIREMMEKKLQIPPQLEQHHFLEALMRVKPTVTFQSSQLPQFHSVPVD